jgi:thiol-disulfide isomerase/thioredoxin
LSARWVFAAVALAAAAAGTALWLARGSKAPRIDPPAISATALYAASFADERGTQQSLGRFQGKLLVLNFWATWCGPCREEIPAFTRVHERWAARGVQFLGLSAEEREKVDRFVREVPVNYPLWVGQESSELGRRLGNRLGVLPFTVIVGPAGEIVDAKVGAYSEADIERKIAAFTAK